MENVDPDKPPSFVFETIKLLNFCLEQVRPFETNRIVVLIYDGACIPGMLNI